MPNACVYRPSPNPQNIYVCDEASSTPGSCTSRSNGTYFPGLRCDQVAWDSRTGPLIRCCALDGEPPVRTGQCYNLAFERDCLFLPGQSLGTGEWCRNEEPYTCGAPPPPGACCHPNGQCTETGDEDGCFIADGTWHEQERCRDLTCPRADQQEGCRVADAEPNQPRVPAGGRRWTYDLCPTALFEPVLMPNDDNYCRLQTVHLVRAVEVDLGLRDAGPTPGESCAYHFGDMTIGPDGYAEPYFCSEPNFAADHQQTTIMAVAIQNGPEPNGYLDDGYAAFQGAYHAPYWTEAQLYSHQGYCGSPFQ
jgi:hypothetical protein